MADRARLEIELKDAAGGAFGAEGPAYQGVPGAAGGGRVFQALTAGIVKLSERIEELTRTTREAIDRQAVYGTPGVEPAPAALPAGAAPPLAPRPMLAAPALSPSFAGIGRPAMPPTGPPIDRRRGAGSPEDAAEEARGAVRGIANVAFSMAQSMNTLSGATQGPIQALDKLTGGLSMPVQALKSFTEVVDAFVERGRQLARYSPELSVSGARADIRATFADIREARELGPELARLTDSQSEFLEAFREIMLPIKQWIIEDLAGHMESLTGLLGGLKGVADFLKEDTLYVRTILKALFDFWKVTMLPINAVLEVIGRRLNATSEAPPDDDLFQQALRNAGIDIDPALFGAGAGLDPIAGAADPQNFIPRGAFP